jgi:hypothetical protein
VSYRTNLTYLLRGGRYDVDQPPLDEQERVDLVRDYHRRAPIRLPNEKLHAILHVIVVEANSRSEMKRWRTGRPRNIGSPDRQGTWANARPGSRQDASPRPQDEEPAAEAWIR